MSNTPPPPSVPSATSSAPSRSSKPSSHPHPHAAHASTHGLHHHHRPYRYHYAPPTSGIGWTPRTPASPHTPLPRASPKKPISKPPSHTPTWLKGAYKPPSATTLPAPTPGAPPVTTVAAWCEARLKAIKDTVAGAPGGDVAELGEVMKRLEMKDVGEEFEKVKESRVEFWKARQRQRKALQELRRIEREMIRVDLPRGNVEGKLNRLKIYSKFIERGWSDECLEKEDSEAKIHVDAGKENGVGGDNAAAAAAAVGKGQQRVLHQGNGGVHAMKSDAKPK